MKTILSSRKHQYLAITIIFLVTVTLIAGLVGCGGMAYTLTITSTAGGSVTIPGEGTFTYNPGTVVDLVATPNVDYYFTGWTGDVGTIADVHAAATNITMNGSYNITANFAGTIEIWDWYDLDGIRGNLGCNYLLMNDLDSTTAGYAALAGPAANGGKGWEPIITYDGSFGTFNGQGHVISDLFINRPNEYNVGLFYASVGGVIENVGVVNVTVIGGEARAGSLVGLNMGTVNNCHATGSVTGDMNVGGLVGGNDATVSNCYATTSVTGHEVVGGLVGENMYNVINCYATGSVTGYGEVGGLVGHNGPDNVSNSYATGNVTGNGLIGGLVGSNGGTVSNCHATGNVTADGVVGGLAGENNGTMSNCYATGSVTGNGDVGGLAGWNYWTVINCYAIGSVAGDSHVGGLVGGNEGTVSNSHCTGDVTGNELVGGLVGSSNDGVVDDSFWDTQTSGQAASAGGTGKTTAEMQDIITFSGATWDIVAVANPGTRNNSYVWNIVDDVTYPFLSWQS